MEFLGIKKNSLLRVLRSDLSGLELKTGRGNIHLLDGDATTSDDSGEILSSPDSDGDFIVHTHEDLVSSLNKQLQIQREITDICERDLQYRTEIIELLTARIVQLESETVSWKNREKELFELKEKMQFMEQLYGGEGARELEFGASEQPTTVPDGHIVVEIIYLEDLKNQIESSKTDMENWRLRVEKLELSLAEEQGRSAASKEEILKIQSEHQEVLKASERDMQALKQKVEELLAAQSQAASKNSELVSSLEEANRRVQQLTLDIGVAEEMRNASLASASTEAHEYATLRGRLAELEGQLSVSEEKRASVEHNLESTSNELSEAQNKLSDLTSKVEELEADLDKAEGEAAKLETTSTDSAQKMSDLEIKLEASTKEHHTKVTELQSELDTLRTERDSMKQVVVSLEESVKQHEAANQKHAKRIVELEGVSKNLSKQFADLRQELASSEQRYEELQTSSASNQAALQTKLKDTQERADADSAFRDSHIGELEAQIVIIREQCALHTSELEQTKTSLEQAEASKTRLQEGALRLVELEGLLHDQEGRTNSVEKSLSEAKEQIRSHEERQAREAEELEQFKKDHANSVAEYEGRLSDLTTGATTNASRHAALENEVSNLTAKVTILESDLSAAQLEKGSMQTEHEARLADLEHSHAAKFAEAESQSSELREKLGQSEAASQELHEKLVDAEARLATLEQSMTSGQSEASSAQSNLEASLKDALKKVAGLQSELDQKMMSFEQLELRVIHNSELEEQVESLTKERDGVVTKAGTEKEELQKELASLNAKIAESEQRLIELESALEKAKAATAQRQLRIEAMEKETKEEGSRPSVDESHLQDLYAEHERQIGQMEQDYDELRIERDEIIVERDNAIDQSHAHESRIHELEEKVHDLETHDLHMSSSFSSISIASPIDMSDPHAAVADLQGRLRDSEERRQQVERALSRRSYSGDSEVDAADQSRDSIIIVDSVDEHGNSAVHEVHKIGSDGGSDTASERTADRSTMAASISMASTTTSQAEAEAEKGRADQVAHETRRSYFPSLGTPKDEKEDKLSRRLSRHSSSGGFSISSALGGASRMVGSIGHSEGHHLFPERIRKLSSRSKHDHEHEHEHEHHHRDVSNPFLLFARERTDSGSRRASYSGTGSGSGKDSPARTTPPVSGEEPLSPTKTAAMAERERKAKEKAAKLEKERAEKVAKIEKEKAAKAEKAGKREKERLEREQKEKERREAEKAERERKEQERKARLKADPHGLDHLTALRQGAGSYYETN